MLALVPAPFSFLEENNMNAWQHSLGKKWGVSESRTLCNYSLVGTIAWRCSLTLPRSSRWKKDKQRQFQAQQNSCTCTWLLFAVTLVHGEDWTKSIISIGGKAWSGQWSSPSLWHCGTCHYGAVDVFKVGAAQTTNSKGLCCWQGWYQDAQNQSSSLGTIMWMVVGIDSERVANASGVQNKDD